MVNFFNEIFKCHDKIEFSSQRQFKFDKIDSIKWETALCLKWFQFNFRENQLRKTVVEASLK